MYRKRAVDGLYGDTREMINRCLTCEKPECDNCLEGKKTIYESVDFDILSENEKKYEHVLSNTEMRMLTFYLTCQTDRELSEALGLTLPTTKNVRQKLHLPAPKRTAISKREEYVKPWRRPSEVRT